MLAAGGLFAVLSALAAWFSRGFLEADAVTHYLLARFAFEDPGYFVGVWARPLVKLIYAVPAAFGGLFATRLVSLGLALLLAWLTWCIARRLEQPRPAYAFVFLLAQPLVFLHSFSNLTELPFAVLIAGAFWCYLRRWWFLMALLVSLSPLVRPEGFGFLLLAAAALVCARRWWWLGVLPAGLVAWSVAGHWVTGADSWHNWLVRAWPYSGESVYEPGGLLHFVVRMPVVTGPLLFPAVVAGVVLYPRAGWGGEGKAGRGKWWWAGRWSGDDGQRDLNWLLVAALPLMVLVGHSLLYAAGKMASNGELRYMLVVAPFWALLGSAGYGWLAGRLRLGWPMMTAGAAAVVPAVALNLVYPLVPLPQYEDSKQAQRLIHWYELNYAGTHPRLMGANPALYLYRDVRFNGPDGLFWTPAAIESAPPGTFAVWDPVFGRFNADASLTADVEAFERAGWREVAVTARIASEGHEMLFRVFVSRPAAPDEDGAQRE